MNIYIDYTTVEDLEKDIGAYTGAGSYTRGVIRALKDHGADIKLLVYEGYVPQKPVEKELMPEGPSLVRTEDITGFEFSKDDILFLPAVTGRILAKARKIRKKNGDMRIYAVIHDRQHNIMRFDPMDSLFHEGICRLVPVLFAKYMMKKLVYNCLYPGWIRSLDKVFTVSNHTLQALNHKDLKWISYFYQSSPVEKAVPQKFPGADEMGDYILFVSGGRPEKNLGRGLIAFRELCSRIDTGSRLCITGIDREKLYLIAGRLKIPKEFVDGRVLSYDYVDTGMLSYMYNNCRYLLFLSKGEGFGLPVLEAIQSGRTVLCSRQSAIPEVAGSILYYVDAFSTASILEGMLYLADDKNLAYRQELVEKKRKIIKEQIGLDRQVLIREIVGE